MGFKSKVWDKVILLILVGFVLTGCQQRSFKTEEELWEFVNDPNNELAFNKVIGEANYKLTYRPTDIMVSQELGSLENTEQRVDSLKRKYGKYLYFNLNMSFKNSEVLNNKVGNRLAFSSMVNQLAFDMGDKIHLISQRRDTIPMADYVYPRMYGMGNTTNLLLVYPRSQALLEGKYFHFRIQDIGLGVGEVGFKIPTKPFRNEPKIQFTMIQKP